jgi:hypothetical protein
LEQVSTPALFARASAKAEKYEFWIISILLLLGGAWRVIWVLNGSRLAPLRSEVRNVALTFARSGQIADAYGYGVGPTAHVSPIMPVFEGYVYRLLGDTPSAEMLLTLAAIAMALASFYFIYRCFKLLDLPIVWRLLALAAVCFLPLNAMIEVRQLRAFEGLLATALASGILFWILTLATQARVTFKQLVPLALVMALLAFVHQAAALGVYGAAALLILRRAPWRWWPAIAGLFIAMIAVVLLPWAARNQAVLHHPVPTRSNFGLELGQAYYAGAVRPADPRAEFKRRHREMHPMQSPEAVAEVRRIGEVEYSAKMGREAMTWIRAHPADALTIGVRQFREFWYPAPWLWQPFDTTVRLDYKIKSLAIWIITTFGLLGLLIGLRRNFTMWIYLVPALLFPSLPYILSQPVIRYRYIVSTLVMFLAFESLRSLADLVARLRARGASPAALRSTASPS